MDFSLSEVDSSWVPFFDKKVGAINSILSELEFSKITPARNDIFRAFRAPIEEVKVVIIGQDPYPGLGVADGLAFSTQNGKKIPASLRNIFKEYSSDLSLETPTTTDLSSWSTQGVMLLNRTLTTAVGERNAHLDNGWREITFEIASHLGSRDVIAILWGKEAADLAPLFSQSIISPHPSPLSAYRGFFGSRPFSRVNSILQSKKMHPIDWKLP